ncbi:hypothetical protein B7494_g6978 [Chlorociboria aeruginascens]|nr:hypothetical protein B7494_g6978 [Chlorociboria aeruginascens]
MSLPRKDGGSNSGKGEARSQNGNASSFRTDSAISGGRSQGERPLQRWVSDSIDGGDGSLEPTNMKSTGGGGWDQFAENERRFGLKTDYDENIYTTPINKHHPLYKQRLAEADRKAREIEGSAATNSHVAEERITDNIKGDSNGLDDEDKYSSVRRQDLSPVASSSTKYTPPARRPPTGQSTVSGAPVDPAIISSQLARPDKPAGDKAKPNSTPVAKVAKQETVTPITEPSASIEKNAGPTNASPSASRTSSPQVRGDGVPNATATVERDVASAFKGFAAQQRANFTQLRTQKAKNDKEVKLNDLKRFAINFKLNTPVPSDLVPIIAKDPAKQKEIQEKARRNAEDVKINPAEVKQPVAPVADPRPAPRPVPAAQGPSPSGVTNRQNAGRGPGFPNQGSYGNAQSSRADRDRPPQNHLPTQPNRQAGNLTARLRNLEQNKNIQAPPGPIPTLEPRLPPTGPAVDPNFSRRSSGVASAQGARLNPNSTEFRPSPFAAAFSPNGNPSTGSSPRSIANATEQSAPPVASKSLLRRKPMTDASERPSLKSKFDALGYIKTLKPAPEKNWRQTGGVKPAYDTPPSWRIKGNDERPDSNINQTYTELFEKTPFPPQAISPNMPSQVTHQPHHHQLPFHLQNQNNFPSRQSPRQPPMNLHGSQLNHGPHPPFSGPDDHRMMASSSQQSYASPRLPIAYPSPMPQNAQLYNPAMVQYPGTQPVPYRSISQQGPFLPQHTGMNPMMMTNQMNGFMASQGMPPGPPIMYNAGVQQPHFIPTGNGHPPAMPGGSGYPSPGRPAAPMMMSQGSQQGHQQQSHPPMYMAPGMNPTPQYQNMGPIYSQQPPVQMPVMRGGYGGPNQFGTSPQQIHQYPQQHRNNHQNVSYGKNFQQHGHNTNGQPNNQVPTGPQVRASEGGEEAK